LSLAMGCGTMPRKARFHTPMTETTYTVDYWLQRAAEARAQAEQMPDPRAKRQLLEIAAAYEQVAQLAGTNGQPDAKAPENKGSP
jgi:hypothetical protein